MKDNLDSLTSAWIRLWQHRHEAIRLIIIAVVTALLLFLAKTLAEIIIWCGLKIGGGHITLDQFLSDGTMILMLKGWLLG